MKPSAKKQLFLKGTLLAALAVNLSWNSETLKSLDLASEVMAGGPSSSAETSAESVPAEKAQKQEKDKTVRREIKQVCGKRFFVTFREISIDNELRTEMDIAAHSDTDTSFKPIKYRVRGGFDLNLENQRVRSDVDKDIERLVKSRYNGKCPNEKPTTTVVAEKKTEAKTETKKPRNLFSLRRKKETSESDLNCRRGKDGELLSKQERAECLLKQLSNIEVKDDRSSRTSTLAKIERIVKGELGKTIKSQLKSKNESDVEEGQELLEQVIEHVQDLADEHDLDSRRTDRLVKELQAIHAGGETYRRSSALAEEAKSMKSDLQLRMQQAQMELRMNPNDIFARQQILDLQREQMQQQQVLQAHLQREIINGPFNTLQYAQRMGLVNATDFREFTHPLTALRQDLFSMINVQGGLTNGSTLTPGATVSLPADFLQYRTGLSQRGGTTVVTPNPTTAPVPTNTMMPNRFSTNPLTMPAPTTNPALGNYGVPNLCLGCSPNVSTIPGVQRW